MPARKRSDSGTTTASGSGLPAKRMLGRSVVVIVGSDEQGLSILSRTLHALGVDMLEGADSDLWSGEGDHWARPWTTALNDQALAALGRELGRPTHALPFPAGWWRRPAIQKIRREMVEALDAALGEQTELWGFADLRTARLLPVWQDVFDELGLNPIYLWAVGDPSRAPATGRGQGARSASMAEVGWFTYNADIFKYVGDRIAAVIDEAEWRDDPQPLMERLVDRLQLRWRGTRFDLFETVSAVLSRHEEEERPQRVAPSLPLALVLHKAILSMEDDPDARARAATLVESAELLRPLIAPFLPALENGALKAREALPAREVAAAAAGVAEPSASEDERLATLQLEVEARVAETRWLRDQYRERLRESEAETEALRQRLQQTGAAPAAGRAGDDEELAAAHGEIQRLQSEMVNLSNANERYLARIYELKKALEDRGDFEPFGG
jgi:hypothetical protein